MTPLAVVVDLNALKYGFTHLNPVAKSLAIDALDLQGVKEALGTGIVVAIALGAHAAPELMTSQQLLIKRRAIFALSRYA